MMDSYKSCFVVINRVKKEKRGESEVGERAGLAQTGTTFVGCGWGNSGLFGGRLLVTRTDEFGRWGGEKGNWRGRNKKGGIVVVVGNKQGGGILFVVGGGIGFVVVVAAAAVVAVVVFVVGWEGKVT